MAYVFNSTNTGYFSTSSSFTRPLTSQNALFDTGTQNIILKSALSSMTYGSLISCENATIDTVYLNIKYINPLTVSTLSLRLSATDGSVHTRTYNTSNLYKGTHSSYWQGFNLDNINFSNKRFAFSVSCSVSGDIILGGTTLSNQFNRYFVSNNHQNYLSSFNQPTLYIGSIINSIESNTTNSTETIITNDLQNVTLYGVNLLNNSTLILTGSNCNVLGNINVYYGSTFIASNSAVISLSPTSRIYGSTNSNIIFSGTPKLPYTFLQEDSKIGDTIFKTTSSLVGWSQRDRIILPPYPESVVYEFATIASTNNTEFQIAGAASTLHFSITGAPYFYLNSLGKSGDTVVNTIHDILGNNITPNNIISTTDVPLLGDNKSIYLNGFQTSYMTIPSAVMSFSDKSSFVISTWIKLSNFPSTYVPIVGDVSPTTNTQAWSVGINAVGQLFCKWGIYTIESKDILDINQWVNVCVASNQGNISTYINGASSELVLSSNLTSAKIINPPLPLNKEYSVGAYDKNTLRCWLYDLHIIKDNFALPAIFNIYDPVIPYNNTSCLIKSQNIYGTPISFFPVCNLSRSVTVSSTTLNSAHIIVDSTCSLTAANTSFINLGFSNTAINLGSINLQNNKTRILSSSFQGDGIHINAASAFNYVLEDNIIYSTLKHGVLIKSFSTAPSFNVNSVCNNVILRTNNSGIHTISNNRVSIDNNIIINSNNCGISVNNIDNFTPSINNINRIYSLTNNTIVNSLSHGISINNTDGVIKNNITCFNKENGLYFNNIKPLNVDTIQTFKNNKGAYLLGTVTDGVSANANSIISYLNNTGLTLQNVYGVVSGVSSFYNSSSGVHVLDCYQQELNLHNLIVKSNRVNLEYTYPANDFCNFNRTYLTNCNLGSRQDDHCIVIDKTNCEKFVVENSILTTYDVNVPCISCVVTSSRLIEGSYVFQGCTFNSIGYPYNLNGIYQTNVLNETGFVSMYEDYNPKKHSKQLINGKIQSDVDVYVNTTTQISEKLIPSSEKIPLKSSRKIIPVRPNTSITLSVYIKKTNWSTNLNPVIKVAANPAVGIIRDRIIGVHDEDTEQWKQITTTSISIPSSAPSSTIEVYVECIGISQGHINIDNWAIAGVSFVAPPPPSQTKTPTPTPSITPTLTPTQTPTITPSVTPTIGSTPSATPTATPTPTLTPTETPTSTPTLTPTKTPTLTPTTTPTNTPSSRPQGAGIYFDNTIRNSTLNWFDLNSWYIDRDQQIPATKFPDNTVLKVFIYGSGTVTLDLDNPQRTTEPQNIETYSNLIITSATNKEICSNMTIIFGAVEMQGNAVYANC